MNGLTLVVAVVAAIAGIGGLALALVLARRYRELREALVASGALRAAGPGAPGRLPDEVWVPEVGSPVPAGLNVTTADGSPLASADFAGADVVVAFLMSSCTTCRTALPQLREALAALPPTAPRPVAVLTGAPDDWPDYRAELDGLARIVQDSGQSKGGIAWQFGVRSYPAVLVVGGGVVRRAGKTASDVALVPA